MLGKGGYEKLFSVSFLPYLCFLLQKQRNVQSDMKKAVCGFYEYIVCAYSEKFSSHYLSSFISLSQFTFLS